MENQFEIRNTLKTNPLAIASLILSAGGFSFLPLIGSIAGIVTGRIALREIRKKTRYL
jgi:ABC-type glucose/galactose transport system permease subunit